MDRAWTWCGQGVGSVWTVYMQCMDNVWTNAVTLPEEEVEVMMRFSCDSAGGRGRNNGAVQLWLHPWDRFLLTRGHSSCIPPTKHSGVF